MTFDSRLRLELHGSQATSDAGLLAYRELDEALSLTASAEDFFNDWRTGQNTLHSLVALLQQSLYSRLVGIRGHQRRRTARGRSGDAAGGGRATEHTAASISQMGRFETEVLTQARRVVAKVEWHHGELFPRIGFIVTNLKRPPKAVVRFYNERGTAEQWIKEGKNAVKWTRLSCHDFVDNPVRLQLFVLAYNLGNFLRQAVLLRSVQHWTMTTLREKLIKIGAKVVRHSRKIVFQMAEVAVPRKLFRSILQAIDCVRLPAVPVDGGV